MTWRDLLRDVASATEPTDTQRESLATRMQAGLLPVPSEVRAEPSASTERRLRLRLDTRRRRRLPLWRPAAAGLAVAGALALWLLLPAEPPPLPSVPEPLQLELVDGTLGPVQLTEHVALNFDGRGSVSGHAQDIVIDWASGSLNVEVTPEQGIALAVVTPEARVRVVGTAFSVNKSALGTSITVARGHVEVLCLGAVPVPLSSLQEHTCLPTTAAGMLGRAVQLGREASWQGSLAATQAGLSMHDMSTAVHQQLLYRQAGASVQLGQSDQALHAIQTYVSLGDGTQATGLRQLAVQLVDAVGCDRAVPYLVGLDPLEPAEQAALDRCLNLGGTP